MVLKDKGEWETHVVAIILSVVRKQLDKWAHVETDTANIVYYMRTAQGWQNKHLLFDEQFQLFVDLYGHPSKRWDVTEEFSEQVHRERARRRLKKPALSQGSKRRRGAV